MTTNLIPRYTNAVLAFDYKDDEAAAVATPQPSQEKLTAFTERTVKLFTKSGADYLILFGLGSGAQALALDAALPDCAQLIVCEINTAIARNFLDTNPQWKDDTSRCSVIGDISLWAQLYLLALTGASTENSHTVLNPDLGETTGKQYRSLQRLFVSARPHQAINSSYLSHVAVQAPDLSVGVILSPTEPELPTFFAQFPDWVKEVVVIWDSEEVPDREFSCAAPIKHFATPLKDFATQRNRMLDECTSEWVLYLDGDETFSEDVWSLFTAIMLIKRLEGCYFPRMTFYPDEAHCKIGYGMWPDLQIRLFRNRKGVRFERPVHEKLTGITGRVALALDAPVLHYSRLRKTPEELMAKLEQFDTLTENQVPHKLNKDYPNLERSQFAEASFIMGALQMLLLEENPA